MKFGSNYPHIQLLFSRFRFTPLVRYHPNPWTTDSMLSYGPLAIEILEIEWKYKHYVQGNAFANVLCVVEAISLRILCVKQGITQLPKGQDESPTCQRLLMQYSALWEGTEFMQHEVNCYHIISEIHGNSIDCLQATQSKHQGKQITTLLVRGIHWSPVTEGL